MRKRLPLATVSNEVNISMARYEQYLLFPQCFQKDLYCRYVKTRAILGKG